MIARGVTGETRDIVLKGGVFSVERLRVQLRNGTVAEREIVRHPGAVCVLGLLDDGRLVTIRNFRIATNSWLVEFCAGKLEAGEQPSIAAARELEEETGYSAGSISALGTFYTSPGFTDELMHAFLATGLRPCPTRLEQDERIETRLMSVAEFEEGIVRGDVVDAKSIATFTLWLLRQRAATTHTRR